MLCELVELAHKDSRNRDEVNRRYGCIMWSISLTWRVGLGFEWDEMISNYRPAIHIGQSLSLEIIDSVTFYSDNAVENEAHFVLESPLHNLIRD